MSRQNSRHFQGCGDQAAGFVPVYVFQPGEGDILAALGIQVQGLSQDHAFRTGIPGQDLYQVRQHSRIAVGNGFKCLRQQGITGKDRRGFGECLMGAGSAAPEIIVIHGRKIVVDQRIGVNHFQGCGCRIAQ